MLEENKRLECLDVVPPMMYDDYTGRFDKHDNELLFLPGNPLPLESKAAFLSLLSLQKNVSEPCSKRRSDMPHARCAGADPHLDDHVIRKIFAFGGSPVSRTTYLRLAEDDDFNGESNEVHLSIQHSGSDYSFSFSWLQGSQTSAH
ncbi:uncharacterized protein IUM83_01956 [Phytophthora cinnamomi]|uniref:uncharacterized protein n=1 Tax=Phytophthora cinnamomi TaxID=4785 RepID=UPI00355AAF00|nr:hypothetical protein IUM83_01956 [Phytophthora cinnamomi]